jgi:hypothetical protein
MCLSARFVGEADPNHIGKAMCGKELWELGPIFMLQSATSCPGGGYCKLGRAPCSVTYKRLVLRPEVSFLLTSALRLLFLKFGFACVIRSPLCLRLVLIVTYRSLQTLPLSREPLHSLRFKTRCRFRRQRCPSSSPLGLSGREGSHRARTPAKVVS